MMRFYVVTVLPEVLESFVRSGLIGKAIEAQRIAIETITPRTFAKDKHRTVDDAPYGGGSGMVMMPGPLIEAMEHAQEQERERGAGRPLRVLMTPQGEPFSQATARELSREPAIVLACGRYEGVDERARRTCDREISLGDFVMMGGEVAAMAVIEAVARLIPGVIGNPDSLQDESHSAGLLEYPQYTRPQEFRGESVPDVLISGHHAHVARWRRKESLKRTWLRRPDLLAVRALSRDDRALLAEAQRELEEEPTRRTRAPAGEASVIGSDAGAPESDPITAPDE
jgi:tRNA (guanine37-N1)-methyltransferase